MRSHFILAATLALPPLALLAPLCGTCAPLRAAAAPVAQPSRAGDLVLQFKDERVFWKQLELARELARAHDPRVVPALAPLLGSPDRAERCNVGFVLARLGDDRGFKAIIAELEDRRARPDRGGLPVRGDGRPNVAGQIRQDRYYAAHVLGELGDKRAVAPLQKLLHDRDLDFQVAYVLGVLGDKKAIPALRRRREELSAQARLHPLRRATFQSEWRLPVALDTALARLGEARGRAALKRRLKSPDWLQRRWAVEALGEFGGREAIEALAPLQHDPNEQVRRRTRLAIHAIELRSRPGSR